MDVTQFVAVFFAIFCAVAPPVVLFLSRNQKNLDKIFEQIKVPAEAARANAADAKTTAQETQATVNQFSGQMTSTIGYFTAALEQMASQKAAIEFERNALHKRVDDVEADKKLRDESSRMRDEKIAALMSQRSADDLAMGELADKVNAMDAALKGALLANENTQRELDALTEKLRLATLELEQAKARIVELEKQYATAVTEKAQVERDLASANEKVVQLEEQVKLLQGQVKSLQTQLDAQKPTIPPETTTMP